MEFKKYAQFNNVAGWIVFVAALVTYTLTQEATVSLWDCGEFVPASYKLEVVHPPGAPFFLMLNHVFTIFAGSNASLVPDLVNFSSALMSAMASLFLFWTITAIAVKIAFKDENNIKTDELIIVIMAGLIGSLAYTWSDTAWFSAVEGEVYAMSSMFIALVSWLMMKWERRAEEPDNLRWIIFIAFFIGLSSGVHLMSLLAIPAMALVYYFRKFGYSFRGFLITSIIGVVLLGLVQIGIIIGIPNLISKFELVFVNGFHMPFWSGAFFFIFLLIGLVIYGIYYTHKHGKALANVIVTSFAVILVGYSSYTMVVVRSVANPAIDMNDPETVFSLLSYLNREQYGDRPIAKGPNYTAYTATNGYSAERTGGKEYRKGKTEYEFVGRKYEETYDPKHETIFPRLYSRQEDHIQQYRRWAHIRPGKIPTLGDNISFFLKYQLNHMWFRYFGWNFIGRQNDTQGHGSSFMGNIITGIDGIDTGLLHVPTADGMPDHFLNDKSRNALYGIPFILGLIGLFYQAKRNQESFLYVMVYFIMTGIALAVYLNMPPIQPRERDYVFVASFYFYAIWIGIGAVAIWNYLRKKVKPTIAAAGAGVILFLAVPVNMVAEEWDDHDRSNRTVSLAFGTNYLESCAPNAVLFTNGDNDTYPLWYAQEVEGIRDDIRIINLSLLNTDWYINQMRRPINSADSIHISMSPNKYKQGTRDYAIYYENHGLNIDKNQRLELSDLIDFIGSNKKQTRVGMQSGEMLDFFPSKKFKLTVDKDAVLSSGTVAPDKANEIVDVMRWNIRKGTLMKADLVVLDLIATNAKNGWKRPIYWAITTGTEAYINLMPYLQMEGLTYRLVPIKKKRQIDDQQPGRIDTDIMYDNVMHKFQWGGLDTEDDMWIDFVMMRQCKNFRNIFVRLSYALMMESMLENQNAMNLSANDSTDTASKDLKIDKKARAVEVLDYGLEHIPEKLVPYDAYMVQYSQLYYQLGEIDKAYELDKKIAPYLISEVKWYTSLDSEMQQEASGEVEQNMVMLRRMIQSAKQNGKDASEWEEALGKRLNQNN
ncbi:DUF2723 domain-containing protein [bacterium]|nr:DUF2723 domain-containing protein [bacterium]